ncbi:MAG: hypothetical protein PVJ02_18765 [Gemmatimonadota bacterium]|jgi:hypothetical protein
MRILLLLVPGFFVGLFVVDWLRRPFSEDDELVKRWLKEQPVTVVAVCTALGSAVLGAVLLVLSNWTK